MINYIEAIETLTSRDSERQNNYFLENVYSLSHGNVPMKKAIRKTGFKKRIPLYNWTMPTQPEGYIRAGKFDLL